MRILYLTEFLSPIGGGGEVMFHDLAYEMVKKDHNHQVHIICHQTQENDPASAFPSFSNMQIHRIKPTIKLSHGHFPSIFQQVLYVTNLVLHGSQIIRRNKIDIIHANTLSPAFVGSILGTIFGIPVVNTVHHIYTIKNRQYAQEKHQGSKLLFWLRSMPKLICEKAIIRLPAQAIHTVSDASKEDMVHLSAKNSSKLIIVVIPNGINLKDHFHCEEDIEYQDFALFIGRLVEYKNLEVVIAAFREVIKTLPHARLVIVGDGPARHKWEEMVSRHHLLENIEFVGYVSEKRKEELLRNCSMIVFPSLIEGFGLVILEAFAHKKPVIASDVRPQNEIIDNAIDGFLLHSSDVNGWAEKIKFLFNDKQAAKMMGNCGRRKVETKYDIAQTASDIELLYRKLIIADTNTLQEHGANKHIYAIKTSWK